MNTLVLTERRPSECRLSSGDLEFLLAEHGHHLRIVPTRRRSIYRITPTRFVGVLAAPGCRLVIRPKVPLRSLLHLLDPDAPIDLAEATAGRSDGNEALDFLALRLARLLGERIAAGLHRSYAEQAGEGPFLQGRLDVPAQVREGPARPDRLHCVRDDFTTDVLCNQVPRATLELLLGSPLLGEGAQQALRQSLRGLEGIAAAPLAPEVFARAAADRAAVSYRPLLDLCRLLAEGLRPGLRLGPAPGPTFLLDLERVFERYVLRGVVEAFAGSRRFTVSEQAWHTVSEPSTGQTGLLLCPDATVWEGERERVWCVVDAKWKRLPPEGRLTADLYQVLAYCAALGTGRAVLVYPGRRDRCHRYLLPRTSVHIAVHTLRITAGAESCRRSLLRLGHTLRRPQE